LTGGERSPIFSTPTNQSLKDTAMTLTLELMPLLALVAGILILVAPKFLNLIVAIFLIVYGVVGLFNL